MREDQMKKLFALSAASIGSAAFYVPSIFIHGPEIFNIYGGFFSVIAGSYVLSQALILKRTVKKAEKAKDSQLYVEYSGLYDEYVDDIAKFFKELGLKGDLSSYFSFMNGLHSGFFSKDNSYKYIPYENKVDYFSELLGARVSTGKCCCRHNASLFTDVVNKMGGTAANISVNLKREDSKKIVRSPNHMVTGIIHDEQKIALDPTVLPDSIFASGIYFFDDKKLEKDVVSLNTFDKSINLIKRDTIFDFKENDEKYEEVMKMSSVEHVGELVAKVMDSICFTYAHKQDFLCFYNDEKSKINQLASLTDELMPVKKLAKRKNGD